MTTVRQPLAEMAELAATMLLKGVNDEEAAKGTDVLPAELMIRGSTGPAPE